MSGKKILFINPVGEHPAKEAMFGDYLCRHAAPGNRVDVVSLGKAPHNLEYRYYIALAGPEILRLAKKAENDGYDAVIIGCFADPVLQTAREICSIPVIGPGEASLKLATTLGRNFTIVLAGDKSRGQIEEIVDQLGLRSRLASFRSLGLHVDDLLLDEAQTQKLLEEAITAALHEDFAETIVLGCSLQLGHYLSLQQKFGVPVIDVTLAGLKYAEFLIAVRDSCGWATSKANEFAPPPAHWLQDWGLEEKYGINGLFEEKS